MAAAMDISGSGSVTVESDDFVMVEHSGYNDNDAVADSDSDSGGFVHVHAGYGDEADESGDSMDEAVDEFVAAVDALTAGARSLSIRSFDTQSEALLKREYACFLTESAFNTDISCFDRIKHPDIGHVGIMFKSGREKLGLIRQYLAAFDSTAWAREPHQRHCHSVIVKGAINVIYGKSYGAEIDNILRENDWNPGIKHETVISMPRRHGKSILISMACAAFALVLSGTDDMPFRIAIFSPGKRQSTWLLTQVKKFVSLLAKTLGMEKPNIIANNSENFWIKHPDGTISQINSFPCRIEICSARFFSILSLSISLSLCVCVCVCVPSSSPGSAPTGAA